MKKLVTILSCLLLCFTTTSQIGANTSKLLYTNNSEDINLEFISQETAKILDAYSLAQIDSSQLLDLMSIVPKNDTETYSLNSNSIKEYFSENPVQIFNPSNYNLEEGKQLLDGDPYDGNPPHSAEEQIARMDYITNILNTEYLDSKYDRGLYTTYLYTSHYIENVTYDRTATNEKNFGYPVLANIISENDIESFNTFYNITSGNAVVDNFITFINGFDTLKTSGLTKLTIQEITNSKLNSIEGEVGNYIEELNNLGIVDTSSIKEASSNIVQQYVNVIKENPTINSEMLINNIYQGLGGGLSTKAINHCISSLDYVVTSLLATSIFGPIVGGVFYYTEFLCDFVPTLSLARLYYGYQVRKADRFAIYVGLRPRP